MKKIILGALAIAVAIGGVAFKTMPKKRQVAWGRYYFAVTVLGVQALPAPELLTSYSTFGCNGGSLHCAALFTGTFCQTTNGKWMPTLLTELLGEGTITSKH